MSDIQMLKLVFGTMLFVFGMVLLFLAYKIGYKYLIQQKRCTQRTIGTVDRMTMASRGPGIFYPVVHYVVQEKTYKVVGPEFRAIQIVTDRTLWNHNDLSYDIDEDKQILKLNRIENSMLSIRKNPLAELYPIGSKMNVFYDPDKPKLAFVERYCNKKYMFWIFFITSVLCFLGAMAIVMLL